MPPWNGLSFNQQEEILSEEREFRRFICDRADTGLVKFQRNANFVCWMFILNNILLGLILWRLW
jgi:hypothetical protein